MLFVYVWKFLGCDISLAEAGCLGLSEAIDTTAQASVETCKDIVTEAFWQELVLSLLLSDSYKPLWGSMIAPFTPLLGGG